MLTPRKFHRVVAALVAAAAVGAIYGPWFAIVLLRLPRLLARQINMTSFFAEFRTTPLWLYLLGAVFGALVGLVLLRRIDNIEARSEIGIGAVSGCAASAAGLILTMCVSFVVAAVYTATNLGWRQCLITLLFVPLIFSFIAVFIALPLGLLAGLLVALIFWPVLRIVRRFLHAPPTATANQQNPVPDGT